MKLIIFSVHDSKAEAYITPFFAPTQAVGIRQFATAANDEKTNFNSNAGDYTLFELGEFDQFTGELTVLKAMKNHGVALNYITSEKTNAPR